MQRSEYGSWTLPQSLCDSAISEPASSSRSRVATAIWPGCGRAATTRASNARTVPLSASSDSAPAMSAIRQVISASSTARPPTAVMCWVPLRSVRPSLASSTSGSIPARRSASRAGIDLAAELGLALADHAEREVGERREVAGGADAAARRDHRVDAGVEQLAQPLAAHRAGAAAAGREHRGAQQHHGAHGVARQGGPDASGVRSYEILL